MCSWSLGRWGAGRTEETEVGQRKIGDETASPAAMQILKSIKMNF
jgi:hypothetical protein